MFNRAELKERAKKILKRNYGWALLVSFILSFVIGGGGTSSINLNANNDTDSFYDYDYYYDEDFGISLENDSILEDIPLEIRTWLNNLPFDVVDVIKGILVVGIIIIIISILVGIFVFTPLEVGCRRWFVKNRTANPDFSELAHVFSNGYLNTVKIMFLKNLYIFGWTLLFIIPGIIKSYEYMMVPYLLAENPKMSSSEAFARSKSMMNGNKWNAFVLSLSFFGWELLSIFTCGIVGIFWVNPYRYCTDTELYVELCLFRHDAQSYNGSNQYDNMSDNSQTYNDYSAQKGIDHEMFK